jgi:hypothetical protein
MLKRRSRQLDSSPTALREDLNREYYSILGVISEYDGRLITIKSWSVTLSLAGLGLGFQQQHYSLFALSAVAALAFWYLDALMKRFQLRYYPRMRDIEYATYFLNHVRCLGELDHVSSPRIDMTWSYRGDPKHGDWRDAVPERRSPEKIRQLLRRPFYMPQVFLPHVIAVVVGFALFAAAALDAPGLRSIPL